MWEGLAHPDQAPEVFTGGLLLSNYILPQPEEWKTYQALWLAEPTVTH